MEGNEILGGRGFLKEAEKRCLVSIEGRCVTAASLQTDRDGDLVELYFNRWL